MAAHWNSTKTAVEDGSFLDMSKQWDAFLANLSQFSCGVPSDVVRSEGLHSDFPAKEKSMPKQPSTCGALPDRVRSEDLPQSDFPAKKKSVPTLPSLSKPKPKPVEIGLYMCCNQRCQNVLEIPRGTCYMNCDKCGKRAVGNYHTYAKVVSVDWLASLTKGLAPPRRCAPVNRGADVPDALSLAAQADVETHEKEFGGDDQCFLITRQSSSSSIMFDLNSCAAASAESVASAMAAQKKPGAKSVQTVCKICCENEANIIMRPCNHGGICEGCLRQEFQRLAEEKKTNPRIECRACPWCRQPVEKVLKLDTTKTTVVKARVIDL